MPGWNAVCLGLLCGSWLGVLANFPGLTDNIAQSLEFSNDSMPDLDEAAPVQTPRKGARLHGIRRDGGRRGVRRDGGARNGTTRRNVKDFQVLNDFLKRLGLPPTRGPEDSNCNCTCKILTCTCKIQTHWPKDPDRIRRIEIRGCDLTGMKVPDEALQLYELETLILKENGLVGPMPRSLFGCPKLVHLDLSGNRLEGGICLEHYMNNHLEKLLLSNNLLDGTIPKAPVNTHCALRELELAGNRLSGVIPPQLLNMKNLEILSLGGNHLTGPIPDIRRRNKMEELRLEDNQLEGEIPDSIGKLSRLKILRLEHNRLEGRIPRSMGDLRALKQLHLNHNWLHEIPPLDQLDKLVVLQLNDMPVNSHIPDEFGSLIRLEFLDLSNSGLHGSIKHLANLTELRSLRLMRNDLSGDLPAFNMPYLTTALLDRNHLSGALPETFCQMPRLLTLSLHNNKLTGPLPECLGNVSDLSQLFLSNNNFCGTIPGGVSNLRNLTVITLHNNNFRGDLPKLNGPAIATFHDNDFSGSIPAFDFKHSCSNSPWFRLHGLECGMLGEVMAREKVADCPELKSIYKMDISEVLQQCPETCGTCWKFQLEAKVTLHGNRLSGTIPSSINSSNIQATALMGNRLGDGEELNAEWLSPEEQQEEFLYFSPEERVKDVRMAKVLCFLIILFVLPPWRRHLAKAMTTVAKPAVLQTLIQSHVQVLFIVGCCLLGCLIASPLYYLCSSNYFQADGGQLLLRMTAAYFAGSEDNKGIKFCEVFMIASWCIFDVFIRLISLHRFKPTVAKQGRSSRLEERCMRYLLWLLWFLVVSLISGPQILFAMAEAVPKGSQYQWLLEMFHRGAGLIGPLFDLLFASPLSLWFSERTRQRLSKPIQAHHLLMALQLCSQWMLPMVATVLLHENCMGYWKIFWGVCGSTDFDWKVFNMEVLSTKGICENKVQRLWEGRCSRAVIHNLSPLLLQKLLVKAAIPAGLYLAWCSLLCSGCWYQGGKLHCLAGLLTKSMKSMGQHAGLMTWLEQAIVWGPFAPFLSVAIAAGAAHNLMLVDFAWSKGVPFEAEVMETKEIEGEECQEEGQDPNANASLSRFTLWCVLAVAWAFQVWHAYGNRMHGARLLILAGMFIFCPDGKLNFLMPAPLRKLVKPNNVEVELQHRTSETRSSAV